MHSDKRGLRKQALLARDALAPQLRQTIDEVLSQHVLRSSRFGQAQRVFSYASFGSEVDTHLLHQACWERGKILLLPRCVPGTRLMAWYEVGGEAHLEPGSYGILEPNPRVCSLVEGEGDPSDVALVPGLLFDRRGYRIGYGGGYYDRFLLGFRGVTLGLCRFDFLLSSPLPSEGDDIAVQEIVTERGFALDMC